MCSFPLLIRHIIFLRAAFWEVWMQIDVFWGTAGSRHLPHVLPARDTLLHSARGRHSTRQTHSAQSFLCRTQRALHFTLLHGRPHCLRAGLTRQVSSLGSMIQCFAPFLFRPAKLKNCAFFSKFTFKNIVYIVEDIFTNFSVKKYF